MHWLFDFRFHFYQKVIVKFVMWYADWLLKRGYKDEYVMILTAVYSASMKDAQDAARIIKSPEARVKIDGVLREYMRGLKDYKDSNGRKRPQTTSAQDFEAR